MKPAVPPFPPAAPQPPRPGLFRQTPPAIFPSILGLLGLGLAWRTAAVELGVPSAIGEMILGASCLLWLFAALAYLAKATRRPAVIGEDLRLLPGQTGIAGATMGLMAVALALSVQAPRLGALAALVALGLHLVLAVVMARRYATAPPEARQITPAWHMVFVGAILGGLAAARLGHPVVAQTILWIEIPIGVAIWGISLRDLIRARPPAPLRPMLAIHAAPGALFAVVSLETGHGGQSGIFAAIGLGILLAVLSRARWATIAGFSPLWGGFTFPVAACAVAFMTLGGVWLVPGIAALAVASVLIPYIATRVLRGWAQGWLGPKTGAAVA